MAMKICVLKIVTCTVPSIIIGTYFLPQRIFNCLRLLLLTTIASRKRKDALHSHCYLSIPHFILQHGFMVYSFAVEGIFIEST